MKRLIIFIILTLLVISGSIVTSTEVYAAYGDLSDFDYSMMPDSQDTGDENSDSSVENDDEDNDNNIPWYRIDQKLEALAENVTTIVENIKMFFDGGIDGILERTVGSILEAGFNSMSGLIGKWVFLTPKLIQYKWIKNLWWTMYGIGFVMFGIGVGITLILMLAGKRSFSGGELLKAMLVGFIGCSISLFVSDVIISFSNFTINTLARNTLVEEYHRSENQSALIVSGVIDEEIGFDAFEGVDLCRMAFGGQLGTGEELYKTFTEVGGGGGFLVMIWAMIVLGLIGLFSIIRYFGLGLLGAGAPLWFTFCTFTGDERPAIGWVNLYARSVFLTILFDLAWVFSVYVNRSQGDDFIGMGQQVIGCVFFTVALILAIKLFITWVIKAVMNPLTLAGGDAQKWWYRSKQKFGHTVSKVGRRFGSKKLEVYGSRMQATANEQEKIKNEKLKGSFDPLEGTKTERIMSARRTIDKKYVKQAEKEALVRKKSYDGEHAQYHVKSNEQAVDIEKSFNQYQKEQEENKRKEENAKTQAFRNTSETYSSGGFESAGYNSLDITLSCLIILFHQYQTNGGKGAVVYPKHKYLEDVSNPTSKLFSKPQPQGRRDFDNSNSVQGLDDVMKAMFFLLYQETKRQRRDSTYRAINSQNTKSYQDVIDIPVTSEKQKDKKETRVEVNKNKNTIRVHADDEDKLKEFLHLYEKRTPYWKGTDNYYYYEDPAVKQIVKHQNPPKEGRLMGKWG